MGPARLGEADAQALGRHTAEAMRAHQRARGTLPAGRQRWAEEVQEPTVDWRQALSSAVREAAAWAGGTIPGPTKSRPVAASRP